MTAPRSPASRQRDAGRRVAVGARGERWPLEGRTAERAIVLAAAQGPGYDRRSAGVGKTRLVTEALSGIDAQRYAVTWSSGRRRCPSVSLGAFARSAHRVHLTRMPSAALVAKVGRTRLGGSRSSSFDDAHLLDAVFHRRGRAAGAPPRRSFVLTARSDDSRELLTRLSTVDGSVLVDLAELARPEVVRIANGCSSDGRTRTAQADLGGDRRESVAAPGARAGAIASGRSAAETARVSGPALSSSTNSWRMSSMHSSVQIGSGAPLLSSSRSANRWRWA